VELDDPSIVSGLRRHLLSLHTSRRPLFARYITSTNEDLTAGRFNIFFFPRLDTSVVSRLMNDRNYERVRIAVSHFRDSHLARMLGRLALSGTTVEMIAHDTLRRVPLWVEAFAKTQGIEIVRYAHPQSLPMHSKFILLSGQGSRRVLFGSMNLTRTSRLLNHEILVAADNEPGVFEMFNARWEHMLAEAQYFGKQRGTHNG
jgi:phosphatidylserine/phosphatidylglycerophosphate/cardiolipin synthase-like enzyme